MYGDPFIFILLTLNIYSLFLIIFLFWRFEHDRSSKKRQSPDTGPIVKEARRKSNNIIHRAMRQANKMLVKSELEGIGIVASKRVESKKVEEEYENQLRQLSDVHRRQLGLSIKNADKDYQKFMETLERTISANIDRNQKTLEKKTDEFFERTQALLNSFVTEVQHRVKTQVDKEIFNTKTLIDEYRRHRLKMIDENIVAILEKTLNITLGKNLSLSDQIDLVYDALEEAKKESFFTPYEKDVGSEKRSD